MSFRVVAIPEESADEAAADPLLEFKPEAAISATKRLPAWKGPQSASIQGIAILAGAVALALVLFRLGLPARALNGLRPSQPAGGQLAIETRPGGAEVIVDGQSRGISPLTLSLAPGAHSIIVRRGSDERVVPLNVTAGAQVTQYFDMEPSTAPVPPKGRVSVATDPSGARVSIDGQPHGLSPVTVPDLPVGDHSVTVTGPTGSAERIVAVEAGGTAAVVFSLPKVSAPLAGWLTVSAPFDVEIHERDDVLGASGTTKIMLPAGRHDIVLVNAALQYSETRTIDLSAGKTTTVRVVPPKAMVSANARPWAEVLVDGKSVGQTPIANVSLAVGPHQFLFRHPQFGERRQTVDVTAKGPNRIAIDFTK